MTKRRGKPLSEETKRKIGQANRGRRPNEEARRKQSEARMGKKQSIETVQKRIDQISGEDSGRAVLTETEVLEIRAKREKGYTYKALGLEYGVAETTIGCICRRETWDHI